MIGHVLLIFAPWLRRLRFAVNPIERFPGCRHARRIARAVLHDVEQRRSRSSLERLVRHIRWRQHNRGNWGNTIILVRKNSPRWLLSLAACARPCASSAKPSRSCHVEKLSLFGLFDFPVKSKVTNSKNLWLIMNAVKVLERPTLLNPHPCQSSSSALSTAESVGVALPMDVEGR
jgi:hypothetical protein